MAPRNDQLAVRPQCQEDWDSRKAVLVELYIVQDLKLPALRDIMTKEHGFLATYDIPVPYIVPLACACASYIYGGEHILIF